VGDENNSEAENNTGYENDLGNEVIKGLIFIQEIL
jgi:hypothetical protein